VYGLIGKIIATPGSRDELASILSGLGDMPGCHSYVVAYDDDPNALWVTEVWESADAHEASLGLPEVQEAIGRGRSLIAGFEQRIETTPVGGIGLD
jgi:quinol monooxygenase YgiN